MSPTAGVFRRLAAAVYDGLLLVGIWMVITLIIVVLHGGEAVPAGNLAYQLLLLALAALLFMSSWLRGGQTLGMRAWRLKVESATGAPLDLRTAGLRFAAGILSLLACGLGIFWLWIDRDHLTWHDRIAGTRVIVLPKQ
ncbi:MAG: RDD family protein [Gammaproteobacteria bacterium PRO9]|nr:RDD family protein [Gammaproteobacteria bacterium PRO9]